MYLYIYVNIYTSGCIHSPTHARTQVHTYLQAFLMFMVDGGRSHVRNCRVNGLRCGCGRGRSLPTMTNTLLSPTTNTSHTYAHVTDLGLNSPDLQSRGLTALLLNPRLTNPIPVKLCHCPLKLLSFKNAG